MVARKPLVLVAGDLKELPSGDTTPGMLPAGGTAGQVLTKTGTADYAAGWATPAAGSGGGGGLSHFASVYGDNIFADNDGFGRVRLNQVVSDAESLFSTTESWYAVPETGIYQVTASYRLPDGYGVKDFGFGVHNDQGDGPHFFWYQRPNAQRWTADQARMARFAAGDNVRMFSYGIASGVPILRAAFQIALIKAG